MDMTLYRSFSWKSSEISRSYSEEMKEKTNEKRYCADFWVIYKYMYL